MWVLHSRKVQEKEGWNYDSENQKHDDDNQQSVRRKGTSLQEG